MGFAQRSDVSSTTAAALFRWLPALRMQPKRVGTDIEVVLAEKARRQYGVLSRSDLLYEGIPPQAILRRLQKGTLEELMPRAYRLPGAPDCWEQRVMATLVWAGPNSAISHRSAAALFGLDGFPRSELELTTTVKCRPPEGVIVHRTRRLWGHDLTLLGPFLVTTVARTLLDCGGVAPLLRVEAALEDALRKKLTTLSALHWELRTSGGRGHRGTATLRKLLASRPAGYNPTESPLELRVDRLLRGADLPAYVRQHVVQTRDGPKRPDFAFVNYQVAVEADSYRWHSGRRAWQMDRIRDLSLRAAGWDVLYLTNQDVTERPEQVKADIRTLLRRKGWRT